jgi:hypothetical protein
MKINTKFLACATLLVYWGPSNALAYLWGFFLFIFILVTKPQWIKIRGALSSRIILAAFIFAIIFFISFLINYRRQESHINNLVWSVITYGSSMLVLIVFLALPFKQENLRSVLIFSVWITVPQVLIGYLQMLNVQSFEHLNPFNLPGGSSAGDAFVGTTFDLGIGNLVAIKISLMILLLLPFWFKNRNLRNTLVILVLLAGWIIASAIYSLVLGMLAIIYYFVILKLLKALSTFKLSLTVFVAAILAFVFVGIFAYTQPDNVSYITETLKGAYTTFTSKEMTQAGRKVVYYDKTLTKLPEEYPSMLIWGVGPGNYSSRSAWIISGKYLLHQPDFIPATPTPLAESYNFTIWTKDMISENFLGGGSITNQPFSTWLSVFAEMGLLGLLFFSLIFYLIQRAFNLIIRRHPNSFYANYAMGMKLSLTYILLLFFIDNLFEWPIVMGQFFVFAALLIKFVENEINENIPPQDYS